jgi:hypothetical protein
VDVKRLATRVKGRGDLASKQEDEELAKFFKCKLLENFGTQRIEIPTVFVDSWGHILAWHLPDIISSARVVSSVSLELINYLTNFRRR